MSYVILRHRKKKFLEKKHDKFSDINVGKNTYAKRNA